MNTQVGPGKIRNLSKIATLVIFLALIRCISEPFRLEYFSTSQLSLSDIKPYLIGSLVASLGLLVMTILSYFSKYRMILAASILTIVILIIIKFIYPIQN